MKWHYASIENDDRGVNESRGYACEIVAWRFLTHLSEPELLDYLLYELPGLEEDQYDPRHTERSNGNGEHRSSKKLVGHALNETDGLLDNDQSANAKASPPKDPELQDHHEHHHRPVHHGSTTASDPLENDWVASFVGLNAMEIAAVASAKKFLSQRVVQKIVNGMWHGDIVFWTSLGVHTTKKAQRYNKRYDLFQTFGSSKSRLLWYAVQDDRAQCRPRNCRTMK